MRLSSGRKLWIFIAINLGEDVNNTAPVSPKLIFIPLHMLNGCDFWTCIVQLLKHGLAFQFLWLTRIIELLCFSLSSPTYNFSGKTIIILFPFWSFLQQAWCSTTLQWCSQYSILSTPRVMYKWDHQQSLDSHPEQVLWSPFELSRACRSWKVLFQHILLSCPFLLLYSYFVPLKPFFYFKFITLAVLVYWSIIILAGVQPEDFFEDSQVWRSALRNYWSLLSPIIFSDHPKRPGDEDPTPPYNMVRNVMDMNAQYGGLNAAMLEEKKLVWVMNVVPVRAPNTLPLILDRGFAGVMHDWYVSYI